MPSLFDYTELIPIYGTYKGIKRFSDDPSWQNGVDVGMSILGDIGTILGGGAILKGLKAVSKAKKAYKYARLADHAYNNSLHLHNAYRLSNEIRRNKSVINSLGLMERNAKIDAEILKRLRQNNQYEHVAKKLFNIDDNTRKKVLDLYDKARIKQMSADKSLELANTWALIPSAPILKAGVKGLNTTTVNNE